MMKVLPLLALLAVPAQAQEAWEGPVQASATACSTVQRVEGDGGRNALSITYDAAAERVTLTTVNQVETALPPSGSVDLTIVFLDNGDVPYDDAWGSRRFTYSGANSIYSFATAFAGEKNVAQILADLANSRSLGFKQKDELVVAYDLAGARQSIARLRECARGSVRTS